MNLEDREFTITDTLKVTREFVTTTQVHSDGTRETTTGGRGTTGIMLRRVELHSLIQSRNIVNTTGFKHIGKVMEPRQVYSRWATVDGSTRPMICAISGPVLRKDGTQSKFGDMEATFQLPGYEKGKIMDLHPGGNWWNSDHAPMAPEWVIELFADIGTKPKDED